VEKVEKCAGRWEREAIIFLFILKLFRNTIRYEYEKEQKKKGQPRDLCEGNFTRGV